MAGMGIPGTPIEILGGVLMDCRDNKVDADSRNAVAQAVEPVRREEMKLLICTSVYNLGLEALANTR